MRETTRPAKPEVPEKRVRVTGGARYTLKRLLAEGPQTPNTLFSRRSYAALVDKGLAVELEDGSFIATSKGDEAINGPKLGRPSKASPEWEALFEACGGREKFSDIVGCSYVTVGRWSSGITPKSKAHIRKIAELAKQSGLPNPLTEQDTGT